MSSEETPGESALSTREAVREKAQLVQAKQARARLIRRGVIGVVIAAAVGAIGFGVYGAIGSVADEPVRQPTGMSKDGVLITAVGAAKDTAEQLPLESATPTPTPEPTATETPEGEATGTKTDAFTLADGAVDIHIYVDYLSPGAGEFQRANARQLSSWISEGAVSVTYHPVALLTANSNGTKYSQRAAAASACVATHSPEQFYGFNHELLVGQPEVDTDGLGNVELADLAVAVGVDNPKVVRACIEEQHFTTWAKEATARALEGPLVGTEDLALSTAPMVVIDGQTYVGALDSPAEFSQFVMTVASDAYYAKNPSPTPSPTPSS